MARTLIGNFKGPKGDRGEQGATGPAGPEGKRGPVGPAGGVNSVNGVQGDVVVVGVNLLRDSTDPYYYGYSGTTMTKTTGVKVDEWNATDAIRLQGMSGTSTLAVVIENQPSTYLDKSESYTISGYIKNEGESPILIGKGNTVTINPDEAKKFCITVTSLTIVQIQLSTKTPSTSFDAILWHLKLERGTVATEWSPAPEDKQDKLTGQQGRVVGFDENGNAVAAEIGGTNLALDTEKEKISSTSTKAIMGQNWALSEYGKRVLNVIGQTLTFSIEAKADVDRQIISCSIRLGDTNNHPVANDEYVTLSTEYKRYSVTLTVKEAGAGGAWLVLQAPPGGVTGNVYVRNVKVELGNVATDWSPAPEDKANAADLSALIARVAALEGKVGN